MFYAKLKVAAVALVAVSLAGSATGVVWYHAQAGEAPAKPAEVKKEDRPAAPVAPAAGEALKPQADEALKLQVALTEIELRMAETKYSHLRKIAEQTELHFRAGVVTSSDRERDQLASELAQFGVEAAIVRLAQTRLGLPPPPAAPAAPLPSVEAAKLQVEEARIGLQVAQVKAKYAEMRTKWLKKVDAARGASQEDLGTAEMEHELASLAIQAALVGVKRAELALDQAAQTGVTPVGTVPPGARLRVQEVQGAKETEYVVEFNVTGITAGVLSMLAGTESLAKMDKGAVLTIRVNPAAGKGEVLVTYRLEVKTAQGQLTWEEKDAPFKTDEWVPMKAAGTGAP